MLEVANDQAFIVDLLGRDPDALASSAGSGVESAGVVDTDVGSTRFGRYEAIALGHALVNIVDEAVCGIGSGEEVPTTEEVLSTIAVLEDILCGGDSRGLGRNLLTREKEKWQESEESARHV